MTSLAMVVGRTLHVGGMRVSVYGVCAAVGLMAALGLSQRTGKMVGIAAGEIWDAGMFGLGAAFVVSRVLLVVGNWGAFLRYPVMLLALPSLTYAGMGITAVVVVGWLRWKRMPVLEVLDAWAPCAALLAAVLCLGHFLEGTDAGMPTGLPWGVVTPGDEGMGRVHPVQVYGVVLGLVLFGVLMGMLRWRRRVGEVAGLGMGLGGLVAFLLAMVTQPVEMVGSGWLEAGSWVGLGSVVVGVGILGRAFSPWGDVLGETQGDALGCDAAAPLALSEMKGGEESRREYV